MTTPIADADRARWAIFYASPWRHEAYWAQMTGVPVARLRELWQAGQLQGVVFEQQLYFPHYSFCQDGPHPLLAQLLAHGGKPGWNLARWFIRPHALLDGAWPLTWWREQPLAVIEAWQHDRHQVANRPG